MRRASKRFWLLVSVVAALKMHGGSLAGGPKRVNELTLAGLRPGGDTIAKAQCQYEQPFRREALGDPNLFPVDDDCNNRMLPVNEAASGTVDSIVVGPTIAARIIECRPESYFPRAKDRWRTSHGLGVGSSCDSIEQMHGKAESRSSSVQGSDKLELHSYKFDWAGTDVPQVMEVSCDASSHTAAEFTLAAATL